MHESAEVSSSSGNNKEEVKTIQSFPVMNSMDAIINIYIYIYISINPLPESSRKLL